MEKLFALLIAVLLNFVAVNVVNGQNGGCAPGSIELSIQQMCELVPDTGEGVEDIVRIYYNPVLQQCLPFSWSGRGGNANRFISIKNCYEICHPSDPGPRRLIASGVRTYLVKRKPPKYCNGKRPAIPELGIPEIELPKPGKGGRDGEDEDDKPLPPSDIIVRQIRNPLDPSKLLTIVQPVNYVKDRPKFTTEKRVRPQGVVYPVSQHLGPKLQTFYQNYE
ncbi:unnamed protein product [Medioppia subpectinata]|uniref:BPTI/Kunitz inhibitor domain-containing protein n=1 Tax=Medioppia subpectinata TaxID=1979941 RepID=A0A7R9QDQ8_9ACAR|nr:unnamed protein product [Medioppia subpectinata]CAG2118499.1 unnamed protein product [Medioppia subpectinata]